MKKRKFKIVHADLISKKATDFEKYVKECLLYIFNSKNGYDFKVELSRNKKDIVKRHFLFSKKKRTKEHFTINEIYRKDLLNICFQLNQLRWVKNFYIRHSKHIEKIKINYTKKKRLTYRWLKGKKKGKFAKKKDYKVEFKNKRYRWLKGKKKGKFAEKKDYKVEKKFIDYIIYTDKKTRKYLEHDIDLKKDWLNCINNFTDKRGWYFVKDIEEIEKLLTQSERKAIFKR